MDKTKTIPHNYSYDIIRIAATLGVIAIHTDVITSSPTNYLGGMSWWFANTIHSLASVSVPLFAMLTGALLSQKHSISSRYVLSKTFKQFFIPLVFWWFVYFYLKPNKVNQASILSFTSDLFTVNVGHLYYIVIVMGLYVLSPLIFRIWNSFNQKQQYFSLALITFAAIVNNYSSYLITKSYGDTNLLIISLPFIVYLLWGATLSQTNISKFWQKVIIAILVILTIATSLATYVNVLLYNKQITYFWTPTMGNLFFEPFTVPIMAMAILAFLLIQQFSYKNNLLTKFASFTFGIYIIHPLVLDFIDQTFHLSIQFITYPLWIYYLQKISLTFLVSSILVFIFEKLPFTKLMFGK